jgi:uncharacterized membrane protein
MKTYLVSYIATAIVFLGMDSVWLGTMGSILYRPLLGGMVLDKFSLVPAIAFYLFYVVGIVFFAVSPAFESDRWMTALIHGALFGFFAYATYDLTNQATLKNWPVTITFVDLCWGTVVTGVAATFGYLIAKTVLKTFNS